MQPRLKNAWRQERVVVFVFRRPPNSVLQFSQVRGRRSLCPRLLHRLFLHFSSSFPVVSSASRTWMGEVSRGGFGVIVRRLLFLVSSSESVSAYVFSTGTVSWRVAAAHTSDTCCKTYSTDPLCTGAVCWSSSFSVNSSDELNLPERELGRSNASHSHSRS